MLFGHDLIADREPQARTLAGGLRRKKGLEQFRPDLRRDADAVVPDNDEDVLSVPASGHLEGGAEAGTAARAPLIGGIEPVAKEVEEDPRHILGNDFEGRDLLAIVSFQSDVEVLVLGAGAVIGEVERLFHESINANALPVPTAATRMGKHALDDPIGPSAMFSDLLEITGQHLHHLVHLGALILIEDRDRGLRCVSQLVQQLDR